MSVSKPCRPLKCDHGLRRQAIVASLLTDVFQGRLRAGQHLVTRELAGRFGVSHTPIREALIALAGIGIIDLLPNRGAVVRRVTPRDVREICQVRRVLECEAVRAGLRPDRRGRAERADRRVPQADGGREPPLRAELHRAGPGAGQPAPRRGSPRRAATRSWPRS